MAVVMCYHFLSGKLLIHHPQNEDDKKSTYRLSMD